MKGLLLHNGQNILTNTPDWITSYDATIKPGKLKSNDFNFDKEIIQELKDICSEEFDVIYITANLSRYDYLEMSGLRTAHHIRLSKELNNKRTVIVILAKASLEQLMKLSTLGSILLSPGTYLSSDLRLEHTFPTDKISSEQYSKYLDTAKINPPDDLDNRHSIANEYAIYNWSKAIGVESKLGSIILDSKTKLYFKFIDNLEESSIFKSHKTKFEFVKKQIIGSAKILLIDDEAIKGWEVFYRELFESGKFNSSKDKIELDVLKLKNDKGFKASKQSVIIKEAVSKICDKKNGPDLVLLDLRLCDDDFKPETKAYELTGIRIIEAIEKEINNCNKGIQIIITSASNKIWNYTSAGLNTSTNVCGAIIKTTEDYYDKHSVNRIIDIVNDSIPKAKFLKEIYLELEKIKSLVDSCDSDFKNLTTNSTDIIFKLCHLGFEKKKYFNHAYLEIYKLIEGFLTLNSVFEDLGKQVFIQSKSSKLLVGNSDDGKKYSFNYGFNGDVHEYTTGEIVIIKKGGNFETDFRCKNVLFYGYGCGSKDMRLNQWIKVNKARINKAVHGSKTIKPPIKPAQLKEILEFVIFLFDIKNRSDKYSSEALKEKSSISFIRLEKPAKVSQETYSQEIVITHTSSKINKNLKVNNQLFKLSVSPQTIELKNLPSNGEEVNVKVQIEGEEVKEQAKLFTAPKSEKKKLTERDKIKEAKKKFRESLNNNETD